MFKMMAGVDMVHVPHRTGAPTLIDRAGGRVQVMFADTLTAGKPLKGGLIRALAVATAQRSRLTSIASSAGRPRHERPGYAQAMRRSAGQRPLPNRRRQ
jgi:tripartite-type tricarboxylate transporter receptor subunit TctC